MQNTKDVWRTNFFTQIAQSVSRFYTFCHALSNSLMQVNETSISLGAFIFYLFKILLAMLPRLKTNCRISKSCIFFLPPLNEEPYSRFCCAVSNWDSWKKLRLKLFIDHLFSCKKTVTDSVLYVTRFFFSIKGKFGYRRIKK